nr:IS30 family transposase [Lactobacillus gigeriorum]
MTLVDRKSRYLLGGKAQEKKADAVNQTMIDALRDQPCESITPDRGKEFAKHEEVTQELKVEFYFPKPHHPWQRGSNENTNGLIREYLPKGQDLSKYSQEEVQEIFSKINKRPRKCLGYLTPYEVYKSESLHLV